MMVGVHSTASLCQLSPIETYKLEPGSTLWLDGSATTGDFTCKTRFVDGIAMFHRDADPNQAVPDSERETSEVRISILVRTLDCGSKPMNGDMYDAMKPDSFPVIRYSLSHAGMMADSEGVDSVSTISSIGDLTIAGVTKSIKMNIKIRALSPTRFRVTGSKLLRMHTFGITPPTALFGLIKADDKLTVNFDLVATRDSP